MVTSIVWNIVLVACAGNLAQAEPLQVHHWYMMISFILAPPTINFTRCSPEKEFLWINFSVSYLAIKNPPPLQKIPPILLLFRNSKSRQLLIIRIRALIFSNSFVVVGSL